jgi:hypothetical protein
MKTLFILLFTICASGLIAQHDHAHHYPIQAIPFHQVKLQDKLWAPRIEVVRNSH